MRERKQRRAEAAGLLAAALVGVGVLLAPAALAVSTPEIADGDSVYVGVENYYTGSAFTFPIYAEIPSDLSNPGDPDFWAYCLEQSVSSRDEAMGVVGSTGSFLGSNYFATDSSVPGKVLWVLAHGFPALDLADFAAAVGVASITREEAVNAVQTAIWRFTSVDYDAAFHWVSPTAETAFHYLVDGAKAGGGLTPADLETTVSITPPAGVQSASSLVGPFVIHTNQSTASVSVDPSVTLTDSSGAAIDPGAVVDGQGVYLDLRSSTAAGAAVVTASVQGSNATGKIITIPTVNGGTPTQASHAQSLMLVAPSTAETTAQVASTWASRAPSIGTTLTDSADGDKVLAWNGGTLTDAVAYENLVPGTTYTLEGVLMHKSDGTSTGISGTATFTPTTPNGTVNVVFTVATDYAGQVLVAFERLFVGDSDSPVAVHEDINDIAQTVSVSKQPTTASSVAPKSLANTGATPLFPLGLAVVLAAVGATVTFWPRRAKS